MNNSKWVLTLFAASIKKNEMKKTRGGRPPRDIMWDIMTFSGKLLGQKPVLSYVSICYLEVTSLPTNPALWHGPLQLRRSALHPLSFLWWKDDVHIQAPIFFMSQRAQRHAKTPKKPKHIKETSQWVRQAHKLNAGTLRVAQSRTEVSYETV